MHRQARGTPGHIAGELLRLRTGARLSHVPYDGGGPAVQDVIAGRVDFYFSSLAAAMPYITSGQLKALAVSTAKRSSALPNVPTVAETGIGDFDLALWIGVFVPRATPRNVMIQLNRAVNEILAQADIIEQVKREGGEIVPTSPEQFASFVARSRRAMPTCSRKSSAPGCCLGAVSVSAPWPIEQDDEAGVMPMLVEFTQTVRVPLILATASHSRSLGPSRARCPRSDA